MPSSSLFVWATQSSESLLDLKNSTQQQCLFSRNHDPVTPENPQTFYVATIFILRSESCKQKKHSDSWGTPLRVSSCTCHEHVMATWVFVFSCVMYTTPMSPAWVNMQAPVNSNPRLPRCEGAVLNSALSSHPHPFFFISHQNNWL